MPPVPPLALTAKQSIAPGAAGALLCVAYPPPAAPHASGPRLPTTAPPVQAPASPTSPTHPRARHAPWPRSCSKKGFRDGPRLLLTCEEVKTVRAPC